MKIQKITLTAMLTGIALIIFIVEMQIPSFTHIPGIKLGLANVVPFGDFFWTVFGLFIGIGCLAGLLSSAFMINKYLRKEGSEFRAL